MRRTQAKRWMSNDGPSNDATDDDSALNGRGQPDGEGYLQDKRSVAIGPPEERQWCAIERYVRCWWLLDTISCSFAIKSSIKTVIFR